jgi:hypothetical protein
MRNNRLGLASYDREHGYGAFSDQAGDFDGLQCVPEGPDGVDKRSNLTRALLLEGYPDAEVRKIYEENTLRLVARVEQASKSPRK